MMNVIPIEFYSIVFYNVILLTVLATFSHTLIYKRQSNGQINTVHYGGYLLFGFVLLYLGLRPIHGIFVDMTTYNDLFERLSGDVMFTVTEDIGFDIFIYWSAQIMTAEIFFLCCAALYLLPMYFISRSLFDRFWYFGFLMLISTFSFWAYGTNGIRNGIATSLFLWAVANYKRKIVMLALLLLACSFHKTLVLPSVAFALTFIINKSQYYLIGWLVAIPLSLLLGGFWENYFAGLEFGDERLNYLTSNDYSEVFSKVGFRWDFLLYSSTPVLLGYHFIFRRKFYDILYLQLFNTYLFVNAFWILVIRASFSNRFAYLSWFLLPIILIYPLLKVNIWKRQYPKTAIVILIHFAFTYFMFF